MVIPGTVALLLTCDTFCKAQLYEGGAPSRKKQFCLCYESVELSRPPAMINFNLSWYSPKSSPVPEGEQYAPEYYDDSPYWEFLK